MKVMNLKKLFSKAKQGLMAPEFIMTLVIISIIIIIVIVFLAKSKGDVGTLTESIENIFGVD
jgi:hypothetical protein